MSVIYTTFSTGKGMVAQSVYKHDANAENAMLEDVADELGYPLEPDEMAAIVNDAYSDHGHEITHEPDLTTTIRYLRARGVQ